jgi:hypothetical protein
MKKLLTIAVAVLAAAAMQAASVNWGSGSTVDSSNTEGFTGNGSEKSDDYIGYASAGTVYTLIFMGATEPGAPTSYDPDTGKTDKEGTVVGQYTLTADDAYNGGFAPDPYVAPASQMDGWYMVTMYNPSTGGADSMKFEISGSTDTGSAFDSVSLITGAVGSNMGSLSVVPEPCSVALLALGLAALGLKRKVA